MDMSDGPVPAEAASTGEGLIPEHATPQPQHWRGDGPHRLQATHDKQVKRKSKADDLEGMSLEALPPELLAALHHRLEPRDVAALACTCRTLRAAMPTIWAVSGPSIVLHGARQCRGWERYLELKQPLPGAISGIELVCMWRDQGWGNRKGNFKLEFWRPCDAPELEKHVAASDKRPPKASVDGAEPLTAVNARSSQWYRLMADHVPFQDAEHSWKRVKVWLHPGNAPCLARAQAGDCLGVRVKVGGGGGHKLFVQRFEMRVMFSLPCLPGLQHTAIEAQVLRSNVRVMGGSATTFMATRLFDLLP
mmetsp:Transcript_3801/g.13568  ORF Transcript_3801/g.13568 Transcript_3801/m.13568 type:complete len:306 (+) Transcript_3801:58-975(+)